MSLTLPVIPRILKTRTPTFPQFEFEWHEIGGKVYVIEKPSEASLGNIAKGVCIAEHVEDYGKFYGAVQTWLRGYRKGLLDRNTGEK